MLPERMSSKKTGPQSLGDCVSLQGCLLCAEISKCWKVDGALGRPSNTPGCLQCPCLGQKAGFLLIPLLDLKQIVMPSELQLN